MPIRRMHVQEAQVTESAPKRSLENLDMLSSIGGDSVRSIEEQCRWRRYRAGERLFSRGSMGDDVFFIVEGQVRVIGLADSGQEVTLATAGSGDTVGEMAAIDGLPRSASVEATADSLVAVLGAEPFVDLLKEQGRISLYLLRRLSSMVRIGDDRVLELSVLEAKQRICAELLRLAKPDDAGEDLWVIEPLPPLRQIAGAAATTREVVANTLNQLYPRKIAVRKGENLFILDPLALKRFTLTSAADR